MEGVGLASYLLIGFYFLRTPHRKPARKAIIVNRIGDFAFLLGMFMMTKYFGTLDYTSILQPEYPQTRSVPCRSGSADC